MDSKEQLKVGLLDIAEKMKADIIRRHIEEGQYATGKTSKLLRIEPTENGFKLHGWKYSGTYEEGRKPGKMPPIDALIEWAQAKGIKFADEKQMRSWAWCLARKIAAEGTARYRMDESQRPDIFRTPIKEMEEAVQKQVLFYISEEARRELLRMDLKKK